MPIRHRLEIIPQCYLTNMDKILKIEDLYRKVDTESVDISYVDYWSKITEGLVNHYIESYGLRTKTKN